MFGVVLGVESLDETVLLAAAATATGLQTASGSGSVVGALFGWIFFLVFWLCKLLLMIVLSLLGVVWYFQGSLLYLPQFQGRSGERRALQYNQPGLRSPAEQQLPFEEHLIPTPDGAMIHTWLLVQQPAATKALAPTIIFFHGNAGNIGFRLPIAKTLYYTTGCNILMVDYRGYGNSTGTPSEAGLRRDAQACLDFLLRAGKSGGAAGAAGASGGSGSGSGSASASNDLGLKDIDPTKIFVFGQSLGGGVATDLVSRNQSSVRGLILENTFTSIADMVFAIVGRMGYPIQSAHRFVEPCARLFLRFFMTSHWSNIQRIRSIRTPVLFISGLADELVPPPQMRELHDTATASSHRVWVGIHGGEHNATYIQGAPQYFEGFSAFVSHVLQQ